MRSNCNHGEDRQGKWLSLAVNQPFSQASLMSLASGVTFMTALSCSLETLFHAANDFSPLQLCVIALVGIIVAISFRMHLFVVEINKRVAALGGAR